MREDVYFMAGQFPAELGEGSFVTGGEDEAAAFGGEGAR
jgi:hypothetical protein